MLDDCEMLAALGEGVSRPFRTAAICTATIRFVSFTIRCTAPPPFCTAIIRTATRRHRAGFSV
jgi:hypothetical protein